MANTKLDITTVVENVQVILHSILDKIEHQYPVAQVWLDIKDQVNQLGAEAVQDAKDDLSKVTTPNE